MKGKIHYRIKDRTTGAEQNWVKDFKTTWQLVKILWLAVKCRAETIHFYYKSSK